MTDKSYTCAMCRETFDYAWTDEEAEAEYQGDFPDESAAEVERDIVCDGCYRKVMGLPAALPSSET